MNKEAVVLKLCNDIAEQKVTKASIAEVIEAAYQEGRRQGREDMKEYFITADKALAIVRRTDELKAEGKKQLPCIHECDSCIKFRQQNLSNICVAEHRICLHPL